MARAKRTTRAEARRRYRAEHGLPDDTLDDETQDEDAATSTATRSAASGPGQPGRIGITRALRLAFHPLDVRSDLRALPQLVRNKALLLPILLTLGSTAVFFIARPSAAAVPGDFLGLVSTFLFQYFIQTPAIGGVFIAGFLAPRASWLLGVIVGLVSAACYTALGLSGILGTPTTTSFTDIILAAFLISPVTGALFASAAAWYRRFLQLSSPNRGRARQQPARRGNDGRSRSTQNQKAGARR